MNLSRIVSLSHVSIALALVAGASVGQGPVYFRGLAHQPVGGAQLSLNTQGNLVVTASNPGDGVETQLPPSIGPVLQHEVFMAPVDPTGTLPVGASLVATSRGTLNGAVNQPVGTLTVVKTSTGIVYSADFSSVGSMTHRVDVYNAGQQVLSVGGLSGQAFSMPDWLKCFLRGCPPDDWRPTFGSSTAITVAGMPPVMGDEVRITAENVLSPPSSLSSTSLALNNIPQITYTHETTLGFASTAQPQVLLPDNHHLCESVTQLGNVGSTTWWRPTAGRMQVLYEASHFLNAGVTGPITITKLRFRGEDGEKNSGGQVYAGVTVELGSTSLNATTMNTTTFVTNRMPVLPNTTTMGPLATTTVVLAPSGGSVPNNWFVDIDLASIGATIVFDPTGAEPNLLVDITLPTAPGNAAPLALIATQDTTGGVAAVRGRGITTATPTAATGTASTAPPVIGLEFNGPGGYTALLPARNDFYGAACGGSPSSFYQTFLNGQQWDLGAGLTITPDNAAAPNYYNVAAGAPAPDVTQVNVLANSIADDALVTHTLGFTFAYPGGNTTTIKPCTNGFIWLDSAMTATSFTAVVTDFLGAGATAFTARLSPYWHDFNCGRNTGLNPTAGLHVLTNTSGGVGNSVCYVTWWDVGEFNSVSGTGIFGHAVWTFQVVMYEATGVVEFRYGTMPATTASSTTAAGSNPALVGFSRGRIGALGSVNPQSRDLSAEIPFSTSVEGLTGNIGQTAVA
ncbi:MAG: hypothetical protein ABIP94_20615, partial [Planctomycetota bacterium]